MIRREAGRDRSVRTDDERIELFMREYRLLAPAERQAFLALLEDPTNDLIRTMNAIDYEGDVATPTEFMTDPHLGGQIELYPALQEKFVEFHEGQYFEMLLTGALGYGKSFLTAFSLAYDLYRISMMRKPQLTFGLSEGSFLLMFAFSVSLGQGQEGLGAEFRSMLTRIPYFRDTFSPKGSKMILRFPKNIRFSISSEAANHTLGLNAVTGAMDEGNFHASTKGHSPAIIAGQANTGRADALYMTVLNRLISRINFRGIVPSHLYLLSSKTTVTSFMERRIEASKNDPNVMCIDFATYEVKSRSSFAPEEFSVFAGNEYLPPRILTDQKDEDSIPEGMRDRIIRGIPVDFYSQFKADIEKALIDLAGISVFQGGKFLRLVDRVRAVADKSRRHPFTVKEWYCGDPNGEFIWELLSSPKIVQARAGMSKIEWTAKVSPGVPRHGHFDLSRSDLPTGAAFGHVMNYVEVVRGGGVDNEYTEMAPVIWIDFVLRILPPVAGEIDPGQVRGLAYALTDHGLQVASVTMDSFDSHESMLRLKERGIEATTLSVVDPKPYQTLKRAIYEGRVKGYDFDLLIEELEELEQDPATRKIDKPQKTRQGKRGTKDIADCLAGLVHHLEVTQPRVYQSGSAQGQDATTADWLGMGGLVPIDLGDS